MPIPVKGSNWVPADAFESRVSRNQSSTTRLEPLFWALRPDAVMDTLPTCSDAANPPRYEPITSSEFMRGWYAGEHTSMRTLTPAQVQAATEDGGFKLMLA